MNMKRILLWITGILLILVSVGLVSYPFVSNYLNGLNSDSAVLQYIGSAKDNSNEENQRLLNEACEYNKSLLGSVVQSDPFAEYNDADSNYLQMLKLDGTDAMATIEIPSIDVNLPIYHGTSDDVLKKGIGHLSSSSLPVGGKGTHTIITGHTGYSSVKMFSDINKLKKGDIFKINVLGETLCYKVDNIATVLPEDTELLQIDSEKDYATLVTCTPFGINSHRLLVRGVRVSNEETDITEISSKKSGSTWSEEYLYALAWGLGAMLVVLFIFFTARKIIRVIRKRKSNG